VSGIVALWLCLAQPAAVPESTRLVNSALRLMQEKRLDEAIGTLKKAAGIDPRSAAVHLLLGQAYMGKATPEFVAEAKGEFQQARELDASLTQASFFIAKIDLDLGRVSQADRELQAALKKKPEEPYLLALLGEVRRQQGKPEEAIALTTKALAVGAEATPVYYFRARAWWDLKKEKEALEDLARLMGTPFATTDAYLTAGMIHLDVNRLREAETCFRRAMELGPELAEPRLRLAQALRRMGRYALALEQIQRVEAAPQLSSPYYQRLLADAACERGLILSDQGNLKGAKLWFERALEMDPTHAEAAKRVRP
jgi:tetratricopeptide (TPR) repeat protein